MYHGKLSEMMRCFTFLCFLVVAMMTPAHLFAQHSLDTRVSISVQNANVREVLAILDAQTDASFVIDPRVRGNVSVNLTDVSLKTAMHYILDINQLGFQQIDQSIYVAPKKLLRKNAHLETVLIPLQHLAPTDVKDVVSRFLGGGESIDILEGQNIALLRIASTKKADVEGVLAALIDLAPAQIELQIYIMEVTETMIQKTDYEDGKVLSRPKMKLMDDKPAEIFIGDKVPYIEFTTDTSGRMTEQVTYMDVGIKISALANIDQKQGVVTLELSPEVSFITGYIGKRSEVPVIRSRRVQTTVTARDGETVYIGGLLNSEDIDVVSKLPFMGNIPLLGNLFTSLETQHVESELVIAVTPYIIQKKAPFKRSKKQAGYQYKTIENNK